MAAPDVLRQVDGNPKDAFPTAPFVGLSVQDRCDPVPVWRGTHPAPGRSKIISESAAKNLPAPYCAENTAEHSILSDKSSQAPVRGDPAPDGGTPPARSWERSYPEQATSGAVLHRRINRRKSPPAEGRVRTVEPARWPTTTRDRSSVPRAVKRGPRSAESADPSASRVRTGIGSVRGTSADFPHPHADRPKTRSP